MDIIHKFRANTHSSGTWGGGHEKLIRVGAGPNNASLALQIIIKMNIYAETKGYLINIMKFNAFCFSFFIFVVLMSEITTDIFEIINSLHWPILNNSRTQSFLLLSFLCFY